MSWLNWRYSQESKTLGSQSEHISRPIQSLWYTQGKFFIGIQCSCPAMIWLFFIFHHIILDPITFWRFQTWSKQLMATADFTWCVIQEWSRIKRNTLYIFFLILTRKCANRDYAQKGNISEKGICRKREHEYAQNF